eukprot:jgi/Tetstr1/436746/TSEL_002732.t1
MDGGNDAGYSGAVPTAESLFDPSFEPGFIADGVHAPPSHSSSGSNPHPQHSGSLQKQLLWTKTFKMLSRAIDDLYLVCDMERESLKVSEAILLLRKATVDFTLLQESLQPSHASNLFSPDSIASSVDKSLVAPPWEMAGLAAEPGRLVVELPSRRGTSDME